MEAPFNEVLTPDEWAFVQTIKEELGASNQFVLVEKFNRDFRAIHTIASAIQQYPSPFQSQSLGSKNRNLETLIDALSNSTIFTLEMVLPTRAILGQAFVTAKINFFRMLSYLINEAFADSSHRGHFLDRSRQNLSQGVYSKVTHELLTAIVCNNDNPRDLRGRAARVLLHLWEDPINRHPATFFPVLEGTWEARRRLKPVYGTFMGMAEVFSLMRNGCDHRFLDYFSRDTISQDEYLAFQEFLFGLTVSEIEDIKKLDALTPQTMMGTEAVEQWCLQHDITLIKDEEDTTGFYTFFMKRHLMAFARKINRQPGPHRTAEEHVMIYFLQEYWDEIGIDRHYRADGDTS